jgi:hypothetical protein
MEQSTGSYMPTIQVKRLLQVMLFCSITLVIYPNSKDVD